VTKSKKKAREKSPRIEAKPAPLPPAPETAAAGQPEVQPGEGLAVPLPEVAAPGAEVPAAEAPVPEAPAAEDPLQALQKELEVARAQADEYLDGWQRSRAEFLNYKRRVERDLEAAHSVAAASILTRYLVVLDDIERALKDHPAGADFEGWVEGIRLIQRKLQMILESEGVERIPAEGQMFDPTVHEAATFEKCDGFHEGQVIGILQQGYRLGDRILRPARVRVAQ